MQNARLANRMQSVHESATIAMATRAKQLQREGKRIIDLSIGEPDFDTPKNIKDAGIRAITEGKTKYTTPQGIEELRRAIAKKLLVENNVKVDPSAIVVSNGSKQSLANTFFALLNPDDEVIIPTPAWVSYIEQVKLAGGTPVTVPTRDFQLDIELIQKNITSRTKAIIINSPCNPTGAVYTRESLQKIGELALQHKIYVISDEIYDRLTYGTEAYSLASDPRLRDYCITINGVSKTYAMTGWRIGYAAAPPDIAKAISIIQSQVTSSASTMSQYAALEALQGEQKEVETMRKSFQERRDYAYRRLQKIPFVKITKPEGAFYLFADFSHIEGNSVKLAEELLTAGVALVPGIAFAAEGYQRISYATSLDNLKKGLDIIEKCVIENHVRKMKQ
jgi:aspartate aminotransferase